MNHPSRHILSTSSGGRSSRLGASHPNNGGTGIRIERTYIPIRSESHWIVNDVALRVYPYLLAGGMRAGYWGIGINGRGSCRHLFGVVDDRLNRTYLIPVPPTFGPVIRTSVDRISQVRGGWCTRQGFLPRQRYRLPRLWVDCRRWGQVLRDRGHRRRSSLRRCRIEIRGVWVQGSRRRRGWCSQRRTARLPCGRRTGTYSIRSRPRLKGLDTWQGCRGSGCGGSRNRWSGGFPYCVRHRPTRLNLCRPLVPVGASDLRRICTTRSSIPDGKHVGIPLQSHRRRRTTRSLDIPDSP